MTALIIIAAVILFFALALNIKLRIQIKYLGGELDFKVKYLFFTVYPLKEKKPKNAKKKKRIKKSERDVRQNQEKLSENGDTADSAGMKDTEMSENKSVIVEEKSDSDMEDIDVPEEKASKEKLSDKLDKLSELVEKIKLIWGFSEKHLRKIFTHIYIENLMIDFIIAGEDACKTAVSYGAVSAGVYNVIAVISTVFRTKVKSVDIACDFGRKKPVYDAAANVTARPSTLLAAALGLLAGFLKNYKSIIGESNKRKSNETAAQL